MGVGIATSSFVRLGAPAQRQPTVGALLFIPGLRGASAVVRGSRARRLSATTTTTACCCWRHKKETCFSECAGDRRRAERHRPALLTAKHAYLPPVLRWLMMSALIRLAVFSCCAGGGWCGKTVVAGTPPRDEARGGLTLSRQQPRRASVYRCRSRNTERQRCAKFA